MIILKRVTEDTCPPQNNYFSNIGDCLWMLSEQSNVWVEGLVPNIEFCKHDPKGNTLWEVNNENGSITRVPFSMYLIANLDVVFPPKEEIKIIYGNKRNDKLLYLL